MKYVVLSDQKIYFFNFRCRRGPWCVVGMRQSFISKSQIIANFSLISFIHSLTHSLIHSFIHSFIHSIIHSFIHSTIQPSPFNHISWCNSSMVASSADSDTRTRHPRPQQTRSIACHPRFNCAHDVQASPSSSSWMRMRHCRSLERRIIWKVTISSSQITRCLHTDKLLSSLI